jgi:pyridoxamine 5'-phosphate oxidase family protein
VAFSDEEIAYLRSQPLARLATVDVDGQPDVVPVAFEFDGTHIWVGGSGADVAGTRKFRYIAAGQSKVALVVDDLVSFDPFIARSVRIYGEAAAPVERDGLVRPGLYSRITRRCRGAGTWAVSPRGSSGTRPTRPFTTGRGRPFAPGPARRVRFDPLPAGHVTLNSCRQADAGGSGPAVFITVWPAPKTRTRSPR